LTGGDFLGGQEVEDIGGREFFPLGFEQSILQDFGEGFEAQATRASLSLSRFMVGLLGLEVIIVEFGFRSSTQVERTRSGLMREEGVPKGGEAARFLRCEDDVFQVIVAKAL